MKALTLIFSLILILSSCSVGQKRASIPVAEDNNLIFYEIFTGSYADSDADGIGDLKGITECADYLEDLGIEGIWLTPIFSSPSYHKYDIADYYEIDPDFGDMDSLSDLLNEYHSRNIKVILDLPINHTSSENPWFKEFISSHENGDTDSPYYDYYSYVLSEADEENGHSYSRSDAAGLYYECNFDSGMPELNFDNEKVREQVLDIAGFYLDMGVDGFRFDAAKYIYFLDNERSVSFWDRYIDELKNIKPDVYTVAEVWDADTVTDEYYSALSCFNFTASGSEGLIVKAARGGDVNRFTAYTEGYLTSIAQISGAQENTSKAADSTRICYFISNHDMDRSAGFLGDNTEDARMAANLYLLAPGSPFIYYGEEVGLRGSRGSASTDANRRLPMPWGDGRLTADPEGATYSAENRISTPISKQIKKKDSLYNYYRELIQVRRLNPEIARGEYTALDITGTNAGGFISSYEGSNICVLHNTSGEPVTLDLGNATDLVFTDISASIGESDTKAVLSWPEVTIPAKTSLILK